MQLGRPCCNVGGEGICWNFFVGLSLTILCLYVLVDKLHKSDKDLHINKEGLEVCSAKQDSKSK